MSRRSLMELLASRLSPQAGKSLVMRGSLRLALLATLLQRFLSLFCFWFALAPAWAAEGSQSLAVIAEQPPAPDFALADLDGRSVRLSDLRGQVVLVNFWATWCPPCRREMPSLERLTRKMKNQPFVALAVNVGEDPDLVFAFTGQLEPMPTFPILFDKDSVVLRRYPVKGLPTSFILDREGRIIYRAIGGREFDNPEMVATLQSLINHDP
jgi:thiol-disulfide isomerase/thioredoxin